VVVVVVVQAQDLPAAAAVALVGWSTHHRYLRPQPFTGLQLARVERLLQVQGEVATEATRRYLFSPLPQRAAVAVVACQAFKTVYPVGLAVAAAMDLA
jgi:hypothetical protein